MPSVIGASHLALTVRDLDASAAWYESVFGWTVLRRLSADEAGSARVLLFDPQTFFVVGLCQPADGTGGRFDYRTTGLDHFAFGVADDEALAQWSAHLEREGVTPSPVRHVAGLGRFISFEDPDGIQFELWLNAAG
jgi:glyoxylase I family protein